MKKIVLYGNCQINNIARLLKKTYVNKFEIINLLQVQTINNREYFDEIIPLLEVADYIIMQNVNSKEKDSFLRIIPFIKKDTKVIVVDSLFNVVYHPELIVRKDIPPFKFGQLHDKNILDAVSKGIDLKDFLNNDPFYDKDFYAQEKYENLYQKTIKEIVNRQKTLFKKINREENLDRFTHIDITKYINNHYTDPSILNMPPWNDHNHPSSFVYEYLIKEISKELNCTVDKKLLDEKLAIKIHRPIYASTTSHFNFANENSLYTLEGTYVNKTREEYVRDVYEHYSLLDRKFFVE